MRALKKVLKNRKIVVFLDFEGTQFSHEIIAIGAQKCVIDDNLKIVKKYPGFLCYVKAKKPIGKRIEKMTNLSQEFIDKNGVTLENSFNQFKKYIKKPIKDCVFFTFGSNDVKMIIDSINSSKPSNESIGKEICHNTIDLMLFISQYIKDGHGNNYSLVNYLKLFNKEPNGVSHNPLNDAIDLMNLYSEFIAQKDIVFNEYLKVIEKMKSFPEPVKKVVTKLLNNETVSSEDFKEYVKDYLA